MEVLNGDEDGTIVLNGKTVVTPYTPYLAMKGDYTDEVFAFDTTWYGDGIYVGARMQEYDKYWPGGPGICAQIYGSKIVWYCLVNGDSTGHKYGYCYIGESSYTADEQAKLVIGKKYTCEVAVIGNVSKIRILQNGALIISRTLTIPTAHATCLPATGGFAIWGEKSTSEGQVFSYHMPIMAGNAVTMSGTTGTVKLTEPGNSYSYLAVDGDYSTETLTFKAIIDDPSTLDMPVGFRMTENKNNWQAGAGLVVRIHATVLNAYCVNTAHSLGTACYKEWKATDYLKPGAEHTFELTVIDNDKIHLRITGGIQTLDTYITHTMGGANYKLHWTDHMPATGDFMIWTKVEGQVISYDVTSNEE